MSNKKNSNSGVLEYIFDISYMLVKRNDKEARGWIAANLIGVFELIIAYQSLPLISILFKDSLDPLILILVFISLLILLPLILSTCYYSETRQKVFIKRIERLSEEEKHSLSIKGMCAIYLIILSLILRFIFS